MMMCLVITFVVVLHCLSSVCRAYDLNALSVEFQADGASQLAMGDMIAAYTLVNPTISMTMTKVTQPGAIITAVVDPATTDFGVIGSGMSDVQATAYPDLGLYPILACALVPIYRLDALGGATAPQLVFDRPTLAQIYLGEITWWNDTRLQQLNTGVVMPAQRILLVLPSSGVSSNLIWTTALGKFYAPFNTSIPPTTTPHWPVSRYALPPLHSIGPTAQASAVVANDGCLGFAFQNVAMSMDNKMAAMINKAGNVVTPSYETVTFAAVELGNQAACAIHRYHGPDGWERKQRVARVADVVHGARYNQLA